MSEWMRKVLESKRAMRQRLRELPFSEKIKILEKLPTAARPSRGIRSDKNLKRKQCSRQVAKAQRLAKSKT